MERKPVPRVSKKELALRKQVDQLKHKPHPLQRAGIFSSIFFFWVSPFIELGNKTAIEQKMLPEVPRRDRVETNEKILIGSFY